MSIIVFINFRGGAPSFIQKPAIVQADGGKKIIFECKIAADPKPTLTWFRDDIQLSDGGIIHIIVSITQLYFLLLFNVIDMPGIHWYFKSNHSIHLYTGWSPNYQMGISIGRFKI